MNKEAIAKRESTIDALEKRSRDLNEQLRLVNKEIRDEMLLLAEEQYGVKPGVVVVNEKGERFKVIEVQPQTRFLGGNNKPWLTGYAAKKDGSFGLSVRNLFTHWKVEGFDHE